MKFELVLPDRVIFERGAIRKLPGLLPAGGACLLVVGEHIHRMYPQGTGLLGKDTRVQELLVTHEPDDTLIEAGVDLARSQGIDTLVAMGGGSVIDTAKAIAMLLSNGGQVIDYIELVGQGKRISQPSLPVIAVPTTAGTGSEATRNAVIRLPTMKTKASLRSNFMIPRIALIDPDLMDSIPAEVTAASGMDALTQVIEPFLSNRANPWVDSLCLPAIHSGMDALLTCARHPQDKEAREKMAYVSLVGGIALTNAGLGAVHGFASAIGGMHDIPHGKICASLLPAVFRMNYRAITERAPDETIQQKYQALAGEESVTALIERIERLQTELPVVGLSGLGIPASEYSEIADKASRASSMKTNPVTFTEAELIQILVESA